MTQEDDMSERRSTDPIASGLSDAMNHGFRGVERVAEAFRESLELRAARARPVARPMPPAGADDRAAAQKRAAAEPGATPPGQRRIADPRAGRAGARATRSGALADDLTRIGADMLDRMGEVAQDVARVIGGGYDHETSSPHEHIDVEAVAGHEHGEGEFTIWNTGALKLADVEFAATDLLGPEGAIGADAVTFEPTSIVVIPPRESETVSVTVAVDAATPPGVYRGLVVARPGDAYVVVTITVAKGAEVVAETVQPLETTE